MILQTIMNLATAPRPEKLASNFKPKEGDRELGPASDMLMALGDLVIQQAKGANQKGEAFNLNVLRQLWAPDSREYKAAAADLAREKNVHGILDGLFWQQIEDEFQGKYDREKERVAIAENGIAYATPYPTSTVDSLFEALMDGGVMISVESHVVGGRRGRSIFGLPSFSELFGGRGECNDPACLIHGRNSIFGRRGGF